MDISVQYLEGGTQAARVTPKEARSRLREAFERVPLAMVLLGWDLDPRVVEACAEECARWRCDLYLWQPLLTGHGAFHVDRNWRVIGLRGEPVAGSDGKLEFTFLCPNRREARDSILCNLNESLAGGHYQGVFLDRIRFPSPASDLMGQFGCFCDACRAAAREMQLDLGRLAEELLGLPSSREGRREMVSAMLAASSSSQMGATLQMLKRMLEFRQRSISHFVREIAETSRLAGLKVGLDCFSPMLTRMVGQDLSALAESSDWVKVMTYARAFAPASLPYELMGLTNWLLSVEGETEEMALEWLAEATGWTLPRSRRAIQQKGLPASVLTTELQRGRSAKCSHLVAGIELIEAPGGTRLNPGQMRADAEAVRAGMPDGVVLSWDLWRMPAERFELAGSLYGGAPARREQAAPM